MLIHYLQIKISIHSIINSLISSLHSYDIHIKFITYLLQWNWIWHWAFERLVDISLQLQSSEHVEECNLPKICVTITGKVWEWNSSFVLISSRVFPPKWQGNTWVILISLKMDMKMRYTAWVWNNIQMSPCQNRADLLHLEASSLAWKSERIYARIHD